MPHLSAVESKNLPMGNPEELNPSSASPRDRDPTTKEGAFQDRKPSRGSGIVTIPSPGQRGLMVLLEDAVSCIGHQQRTAADYPQRSHCHTRRRGHETGCNAHLGLKIENVRYDSKILLERCRLDQETNPRQRPLLGKDDIRQSVSRGGRALSSGGNSMQREAIEEERNSSNNIRNEAGGGTTQPWRALPHREGKIWIATQQ
ncbi:hypothetical protein B0H13DRAFT_1879576 [Mycena leptocephala]|nr:hypothetical protein B0H13DRAFT_1879576 [Mycena leptocephala]